MASQAHVDMRQAATPSKMAREGASGGVADVSTPGPRNTGAAAMDISSPDPPTFSLRQKHPPVLSSKPRSSRKVTSLFSSDTGGEPRSDGTCAKKWLGDGDDSAATVAPVCGPAAASPEREAAQRWESQRGGRDGSNTGGAAAMSFTSPVRAPNGASSSRFTPQRNLGGLFASPLLPPKPQREEDAGDEGAAGQEDGGVSETADLVLAIPPPPRSPKRDEPAAGETVCPAPATPAASTAAAPAAGQASATKTSRAPEAAPLATGDPTTAMAATAVAPARPSPLAALAAAPVEASSSATPQTEASSSLCGCGCSPSKLPSPSSGGATGPSVRGVCCVSNEAFKDGGAMCTLEILVKRDRTGVSALASWTVAELKRRLVHLKLFSADNGGPAEETIVLVPSFPPRSTPLEDDVRLDTLDADVTYKARRRSAGAPTPPQPPPPSQQQLFAGRAEEKATEDYDYY